MQIAAMTQTIEDADATIDLADQNDLADALSELSTQFQEKATVVRERICALDEICRELTAEAFLHPDLDLKAAFDRYELPVRMLRRAPDRSTSGPSLRFWRIRMCRSRPPLPPS